MFSEFGLIAYVTKWEILKRQMKDKNYNTIMVGYVENNTRGT